MWGLLHDLVPNEESTSTTTNGGGANGMLTGMLARAENDPILQRVTRNAEALYAEGTNEVNDFEQGMDKVQLVCYPPLHPIYIFLI
jgi:hypothetical protein